MANNIIFEAQTAIFSALTSSADFTALVSNLYDTPPDNIGYPYVCLEDNNSLPNNVHSLLGKTTFFVFGVYTNELDYYKAEEIHAAMDDALNMKKFILETAANKMRICHLFSSSRFQNDDVRGKIITYKTILHER